MTDALQYLASYLTGDGNVGLTSRYVSFLTTQILF
jgi:hypothetical protein